MQRAWARWSSLLVILFVVWGSEAAIHHTTLDNGLTVLIEENHANPVVSAYVFVRTGSIHEQEFLGSGLSHFFEHILHGGTTTTRGEAETRVMLEEIGNQTNAYTTTDHTAYYITTTTEHWRTAVELLADWMFNNTIDPKEFEREKGVVQRELEQGLDNPSRMLFRLADAARYQVHPVRYPVIGHKELVQQVTRDNLVTYYQRMYAPNNMLLVLVGDVQTDGALGHIRQTFGTGERRFVPALDLPAEPSQVGKRTAEKVMPISQAHMTLSFRTVELTHPDLYPLDVLSYILSNGDSTRLVRRIKDEQQLVYNIRSASVTPSYVPGHLTVRATLEPDKLQAAEAAILYELYRLQHELVSPDELAKAKKQKITEHVFAQETVQGRARALGVDMLSTYSPTFGDIYVRNIQQVTAEDIQRVARQYFHEHTLVRAVVRPPGEAEASPTTASEASAGAVVKRVLDNGMTILLKPNATLPTVAMQAFFKGGVRVETPETNGLSQLMANLLVKGTTTRSAEEIATIIDAMGGELATESGNHSFYVIASCLRDDFATALDVFADVILHPTFPTEELDKMRRLMLAALKQRQDDWRTELVQLFRETFFTISPYRSQPDGNATALRRLQRQQVVDFYQRYVKPTNMVLAIFGDIDVEATVTAVEQAFADFPRRPVVFPDIQSEPAPTAVRRQVKQTQKQVAAIHIGFPGTTITNTADRYPLHILDGVMSGINLPGGWLHHELRGKQLVYVVHAFNWLGLEPGYFGIYAATQPQQVEKVVGLILQQVERARAGEISDAELDRAKQMAIVTARINRQTNDQLAGQAALDELYGLGYDFDDQEQARLAQVTKAEVQRVAQTYLHHPTIVITTPEPMPQQ